jgi:hypothetical protein
MDNTTLVIPYLPPDWQDKGEAFLRALDAAGVPVTAAYWLYAEETGWRLVLASPEVEQFGPKHFYMRVLGVLRSLPESVLSSGIITAVPSYEPSAVALRKAVPSGQGIVRVRVTGNVLNGLYIPDALVYRVS